MSEMTSFERLVLACLVFIAGMLTLLVTHGSTVNLVHRQRDDAEQRFKELAEAVSGGLR